MTALNVNCGKQSFRAGVDLSTEEFWQRMIAPDAPCPTTSAASPGTFQEAFEEAFADDAEFEIRDEDAENIHTIQDILDFLKRQGLS